MPDSDNLGPGLGKKKNRDSRRVADTLQLPTLPDGHYDQAQKRIGSLVVVQGAEADLGRHVLCDRPITIGRDVGAELPLSDGSTSRQHCRVLRDETTSHYVLLDLGSRNGTQLNGRAIHDKFPLADGDKIFLGSSVVKFSVADGVDLKYQSKVEELVSTDALTGLTSKRQYDATFEVMAQQATAQGTPLSVLVMDMDGLKQINDSHGHEMGGFAIVEVSGIIRAQLEAHGLLCRYGGDEFVGCFPGIDRELARELAEKLRVAVDDHQFRKGDIVVEPKLSIGVATYPLDVEDPTELFAIADRALYKAKRAGRNQVATPDHDNDGHERGTKPHA